MWTIIRHADRNRKKLKMIMQNPACREQTRDTKGRREGWGGIIGRLGDIYTIDIQPVHPKGDQPWVFTGRTDVEAETPILWPPDVKFWLIWKDPDAGKDWRWEEKGTTEDEMVRWHHWLNGHEFGWTLGVGDGQGGLACCSPWGHKESDTTEWLNWTDKVDN